MDACGLLLDLIRVVYIDASFGIQILLPNSYWCMMHQLHVTQHPTSSQSLLIKVRTSVTQTELNAWEADSSKE